MNKHQIQNKPDANAKPTYYGDTIYNVYSIAVIDNIILWFASSAKDSRIDAELRFNFSSPADKIIIQGIIS